jgi:hypothetical protein
MKNGLHDSREYSTVAKSEIRKDAAHDSVHLFQEGRSWGHLWDREEGDSTSVWATSFNIQISNTYIESKIEELRLQFEYLEQKHIEKEEIKETKARAAELNKLQKIAEDKEAKLEEEIESTKAKTNEVTGSELEKLLKTIENLTTQLEETHREKERAISMAQQTRNGYVYVISNVGTMGTGIVKIGMTRRIDPMDRVKELGDASVPFTFDVHALIQTDDAPKLEKQLHNKFRNYRVNLVNNRKEFFKVPLKTVKKELDDLYKGDFEFNEEIESSDYIVSLKLREEFQTCISD